MSMSKEQARSRRKGRIRKKIKGTDVRPRLAIFRSNKYIYAQIINDLTGETLVASSTLVLAKAGETVKPDKAGAARVGKDVAEKAKAKNIEAVVFDRCGYLYHGRVKALADGARDAGLKF